MIKKRNKTEAKFFVDGKESSLIEVAEGTPRAWKSYIEQHRLQHNKSAHRYLESKLGDYLSAVEVHEATKIPVTTLTKWRKLGILQAEQLHGRWYYSIKSLLAAIKTVDV